jgi:hypothetical protein
MNEPKELSKNKQRQYQGEFRAWKRGLARIIEQESDFQILEDGSIRFVLPPKLVRLIVGVVALDRARALGINQAVAQAGVSSAVDRVLSEVAGTPSVCAKAGAWSRLFGKCRKQCQKL